MGCFLFESAAYAKCPVCGALHSFRRDGNGDAAIRRACARCTINGRLDYLKWEAPRRNKYRRY